MEKETMQLILDLIEEVEGTEKKLGYLERLRERSNAEFTINF